MSDRKMTAQERAEYEKMRERKRKKAAARKRQEGFDNQAKAVNPRNKAGVKPPSQQKRNGKKKRGRDNKVSRIIGLVLAGVQAVASIALLVTIFMLGMLPEKYIGVIAVVLVLALVITAASQFFSKKNGISGKIFGVLMSVILIVGTFYINKANNTIGKITGGDYKVDNMVVAVLKDDPAESIQDAKGYTFGVQYAMNGDDVKAAVTAINSEAGSEIATTEYSGIDKQAEALHNGEVQAIIYNEGYAGILEEAFEGYSDKVKVIYSHEIKTEVDNSAAKVDVKDQTFSVFISGIDVYGAIETNSRSDVNIIATVNPSTHQILLITTPRDYYVEIPGVSNGQADKLTHAGIYGVDASMRTLNQLYDMNIDFYARVNFTSLVEIVDVLGGVDVYSEQAFTTSPDSGLVMNVEQGINHFDGKQALAFSRERQNVEGGDNQRGKDQQAVITAMIKKMISPAMLINANGIINSVSGNVETNMSQEQIQALIKDQLNSGGAWNIKSMAAEGTADSQYCYSYTGQPLYVTQPDQASVDAIKAAVDQVENGEILSDSEVAQ